MNPSWLIVAAIVFGACLIAKTIRDGLRRIADRIESNGRAIHALGTTLDNVLSLIR